jgi:hypothetical protein
VLSEQRNFSAIVQILNWKYISYLLEDIPQPFFSSLIEVSVPQLVPGSVPSMEVNPFSWRVFRQKFENFVPDFQNNPEICFLRSFFCTVMYGAKLNRSVSPTSLKIPDCRNY